MIIKGKDVGTLALLKQTGAGADSLKRKLKELSDANKAQAPKDGPSAIKNLRSQLGARSDFGQAAKIAVGAGAVAGLTMLANATGEAAKKVKELKGEFDA